MDNVLPDTMESGPNERTRRLPSVRSTAGLLSDLDCSMGCAGEGKLIEDDLEESPCVRVVRKRSGKCIRTGWVWGGAG